MSKLKAGSAAPKRRKPKPVVAAPDAEPALASYAPALKVGVHAVVQTVQDMHHAIADKTFNGLQAVPGLSVPTRIVQGMHDGITQGVYAAVRHGSGALLSMAGAAERLATNTSGPTTGSELAVRSALNGVFGDALAGAGSALAVTMGFHADGSPLPLTTVALAKLRKRVCVFVHGLACDEQSWQRASDAWQGTPRANALAPGETVQGIHYGSLLAKDLDISPIYLRYNTGLPVADNAKQLSDLMGQLVQAAPKRLSEVVLVGHSMGGLVLRSACEYAAQTGASQTGASWLRRVHMLICLGTPHQGAMLEKLGHVAGLALGLSKVTQPLARIANARSQGIKDLRHGLKAKPGRKAAPAPQALALRFVAASLGDEGDSLMGAMVGKMLGDGLVMPPSASDAGLEGDVQRIELAGLGHMALLNHPRVYAHLRDWLVPT